MDATPCGRFKLTLPPFFLLLPFLTHLPLFVLSLPLLVLFLGFCVCIFVCTCVCIWLFFSRMVINNRTYVCKPMKKLHMYLILHVTSSQFCLHLIIFITLITHCHTHIQSQSEAHTHEHTCMVSTLEEWRQPVTGAWSGRSGRKVFC